MKSIIALETLIKECEERINLERRQISENESGARKMSRLAQASTEAKLEETIEKLAKYKTQLAELLAQDQIKLEEKERIEAAIERKKYFDNQNMRLQNNMEINADQKVEAALILDELPNEVCFEDQAIIDIATQSLELNISSHIQINEKLLEVKREFQAITQKNKESNLKEIGLLQVRIPILIVQFYALIESIKESIKEENKPEFVGLPKYEDWWITELWISHQAYFALYKWKNIITNICLTHKQKRAWSKIFDMWLDIKKILNDKGEVAFEFNFAFDALIQKHVNLEEELVTNNLVSMETIIKRITQNEDFTTVKKCHQIITPYLQFKREKFAPKHDKEQKEEDR